MILNGGQIYLFTMGNGRDQSRFIKCRFLNYIILYIILYRIDRTSHSMSSFSILFLFQFLGAREAWIYVEFVELAQVWFQQVGLLWNAGVVDVGLFPVWEELGELWEAV